MEHSCCVVWGHKMQKSKGTIKSEILLFSKEEEPLPVPEKEISQSELVA